MRCRRRCKDGTMQDFIVDPYDQATLKQMAMAGQITTTSLVWKAGMAEWVKAEHVEDMKDVLSSIMPPVPPINQ